MRTLGIAPIISHHGHLWLKNFKKQNQTYPVQNYMKKFTFLAKVRCLHKRGALRSGHIKITSDLIRQLNLDMN